MTRKLSFIAGILFTVSFCNARYVNYEQQDDDYHWWRNHKPDWRIPETFYDDCNEDDILPKNPITSVDYDFAKTVSNMQDKLVQDILTYRAHQMFPTNVGDDFPRYHQTYDRNPYDQGLASIITKYQDRIVQEVYKYNHNPVPNTNTRNEDNFWNTPTWTGVLNQPEIPCTEEDEKEEDTKMVHIESSNKDLQNQFEGTAPETALNTHTEDQDDFTQNGYNYEGNYHNQHFEPNEGETDMFTERPQVQVEEDYSQVESDQYPKSSTEVQTPIHWDPVENSSEKSSKNSPNTYSEDQNIPTQNELDPNLNDNSYYNPFSEVKPTDDDIEQVSITHHIKHVSESKDGTNSIPQPEISFPEPE